MRYPESRDGIDPVSLAGLQVGIQVRVGRRPPLPYTIDLSEMGFSDAGEKGTRTAQNRNRIGRIFSTKREKRVFGSRDIWRYLARNARQCFRIDSKGFTRTVNYVN